MVRGKEWPGRLRRETREVPDAMSSVRISRTPYTKHFPELLQAHSHVPTVMVVDKWPQKGTAVV